MSIQVETVALLKDNYCFLLHENISNVTVAIDPSEHDPVIERLESLNWNLTAIFNTHHHWDHTGGNLGLKKRYACKIVGGLNESGRIPGLDLSVTESSQLEIGVKEVRVLEIPGHTLGAVSYFLPESGMVFTGDTLFAGGCGRIFEGNPKMMYESLTKLKNLPLSTRVFCGHEYTLANLKFAMTVEPENMRLKERIKKVEAQRHMNEATVPSTLEEELETNPFLRPHSPEIKTRLGKPDASDVQVFAELRKRKDNF